jgi:hypothetical protein
MTPCAATSAPAGEPEKYFAGGEEPSLADLFSDDVLLRVLQDDPSRIAALKDLIAEVRSGLLAASAPTA